jgi:hypothetical protein
MLNKTVEFTIRGTVDWCKLLGAARPYTGDPRYDKGPNWSIEMNPDEKSRATLKKYGLSEKFKKDKTTRADGSPAKNPRSYDFVRLTILENRADGKKASLPEVKDASGVLWNQDVDIGNGSVADILVRYVDYGTTKGLYFKKMRVLRHVEFDGGADFEPLSEDDEFFGAAEEVARPEGESADDQADTTGESENIDDIPE